MIDYNRRKRYNYLKSFKRLYLMIEENFDKIYKAFRIDLYRHIFSILGKREGSLSATDYFSAETIFLIGTPTVSEFAKAFSISQPNATYRIKSLMEKGYVEKFGADKKSASRLRVTEKFMRFYHEDLAYGNFIFHRLSEQLNAEELAEVDKIFENFIKQIETEQGERKSC